MSRVPIIAPAAVSSGEDSHAQFDRHRIVSNVSDGGYRCSDLQSTDDPSQR
jgi:hypothetical protein